MAGLRCSLMGEVISGVLLSSLTMIAAQIIAAPSVAAQVLINATGSGVRLVGTDQAVLEIREPRKDLPCTLVPMEKSQLGFDMKFHAGFEVTVPLKELAGNENVLTMVFRVYPPNAPESAVYLTQKVRVPAIEEDAKGEASLFGNFDLGEGDYKVDWLMRDRLERVCSSYWDVKAELPNKDSQMGLQIAANTVRASDVEQFRMEPPVERDPALPLRVKVLLNYAPQRASSANMRPIDTTALVSILRHLAREPKIGQFSLVAFNMPQQAVVYRQEKADKIDFPALGESLAKLKHGTVDYAKLGDKDSETKFLAELIRAEVGGEDKPDAIIFAGPKVLLDHNVESDVLKEIGNLDFPVFYLNYNLYPAQIPWRDSISHAVRYFKGQEFTISRPRDLWFAISEVVSKVVSTKNPKIAQNALR